MGAWGTGPYDNDSAADWLSDALDETVCRIEDCLNGGTEWERRAAAWLLLQIGHNYVYPAALLDKHIDLAIKEMTRISAREACSEDAAFAEETEKLLADLIDRKEAATPPRKRYIVRPIAVSNDELWPDEDPMVWAVLDMARVINREPDAEPQIVRVFSTNIVADEWAAERNAVMG